jgi:hypothetical protein
MSIESSVSALAQLLANSTASPYARPERVTPSTFYDLDYRVCVVAACFEVHAKEDEARYRRILSAKLKLLQFIAIRSWLFPIVREWSASRDDPQRSAWSSQSLRRGFLGDSMHDEVINYMVAGGLLVKAQSHLVDAGVDFRLRDINRNVVSSALFARERKTIVDLKNLTITNAMLEGW